jgi:hypothetical protein
MFVASGFEQHACNEKSTQDKKKIDTDPTRLKESIDERPESAGIDVISEVHDEDQQNGDTANAVERRRVTEASAYQWHHLR